MQQAKTNFKTPHIPHESKLYTTAETAAILSVSLRTVQAWIREGAIPCIRLGDGHRLVRIQGRAIDDFIRSGMQRR